MSSRTLILLALGFLAAGYLAYGRFIARVLGIDASRTTPAHSRSDGVDFVPARHWLVLFGHHFSSICAAGPIVGPVLAVAYWGWGPSVIWILIGGVFLGAVADFSSLVAAVRHGGVSISEVSGRVISPRARTLFAVFTLIALVLVLAVFADLAAGTFVKKPEIVAPSLGILPIAALAGMILYRGRDSLGKLAAVTVGGLASIGMLVLAGPSLAADLPGVGGLSSQQIWVLLLLVYCFVASVLPVQFLLQPRDYLSAYVLFLTIGLGILGAVVISPPISASLGNGFLPDGWAWAAAGPLWPMMFVTIACGAISGFHSIVSSGTTCKQLGSEAHACRIGYGSMLIESLVAVLVVICVGAGLTAARHAELIRQPGGAITAFGEGYGVLTAYLFGDYGTAFAVMALNFFILTTLDSATRLGRYLLSELLGWQNRYLPTVIVTAVAGALALSGQWRLIWPAFGASNQLVAALSLLVVSCWLLGRRRSALPVLIPAVVMLVTTIGAFLWQIFVSVRGPEPKWLIASVDAILVILALAVLVEAWGPLRGRVSTAGQEV